MNKDIGIYIHIPFCTSKCYYCDFTSFVCKNETNIENYINAVCNEILQNAEILSEYNISTIYFGGGTPSYIDSKYIEKILDTLRLFSVNVEDIKSSLKEITIEVNPNSITEEKLKSYKKSGINRISIGLQSLNDTVLKTIGRKHTYSDFLEVLELCKKVGIYNISVDLIYPLPGLTLDEFKRNIEKLMSISEEYNIKHISIYNLEIHENTKLEFLINEKFVEMVDEDTEYLMKEFLEDTLLKNGYNKYEISNFSKDGFESKHNLNYWNQGEYLGFGVSASSFFSGTRYTNTNNFDKYIYNINENKSNIIESEALDKLALMKEYVILRLRLKDGVNKEKFIKRFNTDIYDIFGIELNELLEKRLIKQENNNIFLTKRGTEVANLVWEKFI